MKKILLLAVLSNLLIAVRTSAQTSTVSHPAAPSPDNFSSVLASAPFRDPSLLNAARVDDLVSRMTLEEKVQQMMHAAPAIPRLGIPAYNWWSEGLHGVANTGYATVFPQAIGMAASFDPDLLHTEAGVIATEFRASTTKNCARKAIAVGFTGLRSGLLTSIFFAIPVGDAVRKRTAKTRS